MVQKFWKSEQLYFYRAPPSSTKSFVLLSWLRHHNNYFKITETVTVVGQKLKICATKTRAANKRRVAFLAKIATRWIYFIHIFRQLLVPNLSKSEKKSSVLALGAYYTDYQAKLKWDSGPLYRTRKESNGKGFPSHRNDPNNFIRQQPQAGRH